MDNLKFGTDGWRDIIGERFTVANLGRAAQAYAEYLLEENKTPGPPRVVVSYDTRFNSELFGRRAAEVLAANGLEVLLSESYLPTPALSFAVKHLNAAGGVMLTASHNPPAYHGFKLKGSYGGTATDTIYRAVSERSAALSPHDVKPFDASQHGLERFSIRNAYYAALRDLIDLDVLNGLTVPVIHDAMGGAGTGWLTGFFDHVGSPVEASDLRPEPDPLFYGVNPEPIESNLGAAQARMRGVSEGVVMATDGDADRIGVVLPGGHVFNSHQIFAVLLDQLSRKGETGSVVKTFTVSRVVERLAKRRGYEVIETPVGFKYIVDAMLTGNVLIGGEESGGIGVSAHLPERDGLANSLLLLEAMARSGKTLDELFKVTETEVDWRHAYDRLDLHLEGNELKDAVMKRLDNPPDTFAGQQISSVERLDGVKLNLDKAWLMFRPSGTEPVLRIYCEAQTAEEVGTLLTEAERFVAGS